MPSLVPLKPYHCWVPWEAHSTGNRPPSGRHTGISTGLSLAPEAVHGRDHVALPAQDGIGVGPRVNLAGPGPVFGYLIKVLPVAQRCQRR